MTFEKGTQLAALARVSSVHLSEPTSDVPGSLFHSRVNTASPGHWRRRRRVELL